jgi:hypothetical protein
MWWKAGAVESEGGYGGGGSVGDGSVGDTNFYDGVDQ